MVANFIKKEKIIMIFYFNVKGESVGITPERIFQGGKNSNAITFVGAVADVDVVSARFEYDVDLKVENAVLKRDENFSAIKLSDEFGNGYTAWTCDLPATVSAKSGLVNLQFFITTPTGSVISTSAVSFDVEDGVDNSEPVKSDTYEQVLASLSALKAQVDNLELGGSEETETDTGTKLYRYQVNGTFVDHMSSTTFRMVDLVFISTRNLDISEYGLTYAMRTSLAFIDGCVEEEDEDYSVGRYLPIKVFSGSGLNSILMMDHMGPTVKEFIFENIVIDECTISEI